MADRRLFGAAAFVLAFVSPLDAQAADRVLCSATVFANSQTSGFCKLRWPAHISALSGPFNHTSGAGPSVRLQGTNGQTYGPFATTVAPGAFQWQARVNFSVPPGAYQFVQSRLTGWSGPASTMTGDDGHGQRLSNAGAMTGRSAASSSSGAGGGNALPNGPFCVRNAGAVADTYPCTGAVKPSGFTITLRLKKAIPAALDQVKFYTVPVTSTSAVLATISGSGTAVGSDYTITAPPQLCMNTGTTYSIRVFAGGISYGDVGQFWPDCR
jgi:hypothetical protein